MSAKLTSIIAAIGLAAVAGTAQAGVTEVNQGLAELRNWNTIVFGDLSASSDTFGRAFVGGDFSGTTEFFANPMGSATPGLVVVGNVTSGTVHLENGGGATIGGAVLPGAALDNHGGGVVSVGVGQADLEDQRDTMQSNLVELSQYLKDLSPTDTATVVPNSSSFVVTPGETLAIFDLGSLSELTNADPHFTLNGADTVVINVGGTNVTIPFNFNGNSDIAQHVIWNFYEAQTITFGRQFWGTVLAPLAAASSTSEITGGAVFASFTQNAQMHTPDYTGTYQFPGPPPTPGVPEPASWALMILGFGGAGAMLRRRRAASAA
jgi:choice-of-anchor A domain-containing protein